MSDQAPINLTNQFLIAMPGVSDGNFAGTVVYMCEHTEHGALGLVINHPLEIDVRALFEKSTSRSTVTICCPPRSTWAARFRPNEALSCTNNWTTKGALQLVPQDRGRPGDDHLARCAGGHVQWRRPRKVFITLGYSGWSAGQLEDEIARNGWLTVDADRSIIFDSPVEERYDRALSLLGIDLSVLSSEAGHA